MFFKALAIIGTTLAGLSVSTGIATPQAPAPTDFDAAVARVEAAALSEDAAALKAARIALLRQLAATTDPARSALLRYTVAYAGWRLAFAPNVSATEKHDLLDDAETQLKETSKLSPNFAEAPALLSAVYGAK